MGTWIALLRGVNVGGKNTLPMAKLRSDLESMKLANVRTYIQSGNVVFESSSKSPASLEKAIAGRIEEQHGFRPQVVILKHHELVTAIDSNPFAEATTNPKSLHLFFLAEPAREPNTHGLAEARSPTESYKLIDRVFYLYAPDGVGRSKLASNAERYLGVVSTARNYQTVAKLLELASQA